jgi:hypothetical protein
MRVVSRSKCAANYEKSVSIDQSLAICRLGTVVANVGSGRFGGWVRCGLVRVGWKDSCEAKRRARPPAARSRLEL